MSDDQGTQNFPPIAPEDLAKLGIDSELIPLIVSIASQPELSPDGSSSPSLTQKEAENLVEILDKVVSSNTANSGLKSRCFRVLRKVSSGYGILPKSYYLFEVLVSGTIPHTIGVFADIWEGQIGGNKVCIKAFRTQTTANLGAIKRRLYRECVGWKYVSHPNVLPFLGVSESLFPFCIISPWLPNGNILEFIECKPEINRFKLLSQAASGLEHLHLLSIVHNNITPENIMITKGGEACVGNFGIAGIITDSNSEGLESMTTSKPSVVRYMAPELLDPVKASFTRSNPPKESDIFSLGMTAYQVLSDRLPYGIRGDSVIAYKIVAGERPPRPDNPIANKWLPDPIWDIIQHCWDQIPESRLPVDQIHRIFEEMGSQQKGNALIGEEGNALIGEEGKADSPSEPVRPRPREPPPPEKGDPIQDKPPQTEPLVDNPQYPIQPTLTEYNRFKDAFSGFRRIMKQVSCFP